VLELVQCVLDVSIAEEDDGVLVAAALEMRLAVGDAFHVAAGRPDLFEFSGRTIEPQLSLQHERNVGGLVLMEHRFRVRCELEDDIDDAVLAVDVVDIEPDVLQPVDRVPSQVAVVELEIVHALILPSFARYRVWARSLASAGRIAATDSCPRWPGEFAREVVV